MEDKTEATPRKIEYRGYEVEIREDDASQQMWFEFAGKEYGCGHFNPFPEEEVKAVIDRHLAHIAETQAAEEGDD